MEESMLRISLHEHIESEIIKVEQSEGCDHGVSQAEFPLGWTCCKVHRLQVDPCSCQVVSKKSETSWKTSTMMRR